MTRILNILLCMTLLTCPVVGDEDSPRSFDDIYKDWSGIDAKLEQVIESYREAEPEERKQLLVQYNKLVESSRKMLPTLKSAASDAYQKNPNQDERVTKTLVGMVANEVRQDRYEDAIKLGLPLVKNECGVAAIYSFMGVAAYCTDDFESAAKYLTKAKSEDVLTQTASGCLQDLPTAQKAWTQELQVREKEAAADDLPRVKITTSKGTMIVELYENEAPQAVGNFVSLVESGYYDGLVFHRVLPGFMAQGGCPDGSGRGGPGYQIYCECHQENHRKHFRGTLSMAHAGKDTGGSQFFLTFKRTSHLDGRHTVFGRVIEGLDILAEIQRVDPSQPGSGAEPDTIKEAKVVRKRDHEYRAIKVGEEK